MDFEIPAFECTKCTASVNGKDIKVAPYGCSGNISGDFKVVYIENCDEVAFLQHKSLEGCCVFVNQLEIDLFKKLVELKASAFVAISGKYYQNDENSDLVERMLRENLQSIGKIPGFVMWSKDAQEILVNEVETIYLELEQTEMKHTSRDVLAVIEGSEIKDESIVICGHYDSVLVGTGSWDNATGAAMVSRLYKYFLANPPKRTLRFVWCGSEEQGLYGSINYIKQHQDILEEIKFVFNFDMNGTILGTNNAFITGGPDLKTYYEQACKEYGYSSKTMMIIHSSDSAPFALKGIPSLGLSRGQMTAYEIHTRHDLMPALSAKEMYKNFEFAAYLIAKFTNSAVLPVERKLPDDMKKKADEYFRLDKLPNYKVFED